MFTPISSVNNCGAVYIFTIIFTATTTTTGGSFRFLLCTFYSSFASKPFAGTYCQNGGAFNYSRVLTPFFRHRGRGVCIFEGVFKFCGSTTVSPEEVRFYSKLPPYFLRLRVRSERSRNNSQFCVFVGKMRTTLGVWIII